jgi:putative ABC transport system permease protein
MRRLLRELLLDSRHAVRFLRRSAGFTVAALLTMALAIGANTAVFSVVYGVLARPLPYPDADRLVRLSEEHPGGTPLVVEAVLTDLTFDTWRSRATTVEGFAAYTTWERTVTIGQEPERIAGATVSPSIFGLLGAAPAAGRFFREDEALAGASDVVVISNGLWQRRFGGQASVVGTTMMLDGRPHVIAGVAPAWFYFPDHGTEFWTPHVFPKRDSGSADLLWALARLKPGVSPAQAAAEGTSAARSVTRPMAAELLFGKGGPVEVHVRRLAEEMTGSVRPALVALAVAVAFVMLIACANVASLFLARGVSRETELSVRAALGAGRGRLVRQLLTESLALGAAGGVAGLAVAWLLTSAFPAFAPESFPRIDEVRIDWRVLGFALAISLAAGAIAGVLPALRGARSGPANALRSGGDRVTSQGERIRALLLAGEAALAVLLTIGAALVARSFTTLVSVDAGYDTRNVLAARVYLSGPNAIEIPGPFVESLVDRLRAAPGVVAVGAGNMAPLGDASFVSGFTVSPAGPSGRPVVARALQYVVTPGYAEALGLRLREGRLFRPQDGKSGPEAMIVNESFARTYFNDGRPVVGRRHKGMLGSDDTIIEVVGVVADVLKDGLDQEPQPEIYLALSGQFRIRRVVNLIVRTAGDPAAFVPTLRETVRQVDRRAAIGETAPLAEQVATSVSEPRLGATVLAAFAGLALSLAATGLYGVLSYSVSQRRREIGIRAALGATRGALLSMVIRRGLGVTAIGAAAGLVAAAGATRMIEHLLFGVTPLDARSFVVGPVLLLLVALLSTVLPARRAARVDPAEALRSE